MNINLKIEAKKLFLIHPIARVAKIGEMTSSEVMKARYKTFDTLPYRVSKLSKKARRKS
jgi:hypothetical protein